MTDGARRWGGGRTGAAMTDGLSFGLGGAAAGGRARGRALKRRRVVTAPADESRPGGANSSAFGAAATDGHADGTVSGDGERPCAATVPLASARVDVFTAAVAAPVAAAASPVARGENTAPASQVARLIERRRARAEAGALDDDAAYRLDVEECVDVATANDYSRVPIESFGGALLRRMGWDGRPDGRSDALAAAPVSKLLGGKPAEQPPPMMGKRGDARSGAGSKRPRHNVPGAGGPGGGGEAPGAPPADAASAPPPLGSDAARNVRLDSAPVESGSSERRPERGDGEDSTRQRSAGGQGERERARDGRADGDDQSRDRDGGRRDEQDRRRARKGGHRGEGAAQYGDRRSDDRRGDRLYGERRGDRRSDDQDDDRRDGRYDDRRYRDRRRGLHASRGTR